MKTLQLVLVTFTVPSTIDTAWRSVEDIEDRAEPLTIKAAGWLLEDSDDKVVVALMTHGGRRFKSYVTISPACVLDIDVIKEAVVIED